MHATYCMCWCVMCVWMCLCVCVCRDNNNDDYLLFANPTTAIGALQYVSNKENEGTRYLGINVRHTRAHTQTCMRTVADLFASAKQISQ